MKRILGVVLSAFMTMSVVKADEGMWLLPLLKQLNEAEMQDMGFELSAEDIYSVNNSSLKDAVMIFGGGCTGEFISPEGLVLTNHHCGYGVIQQHSTVEHDYLKNGFWAMDRGEEIPSPGLTVKLLVSIEEVTDLVLANVSDTLSEDIRNDSIVAAINRMEEDADTAFITTIKPFFSGNSFYRFTYQEYSDVRFVGAPPSSIGKFGADTDNWMWPRHTGDFSLFRVYAAPDGSPADYAEENVPLKPKRHLKVSMAGVQNHDFAMIMGFPGSTSRYMSSWGVDQRMRIANQALIDIRAVKQASWLEDMRRDPAINIKYASKYARSSNYYKNSIGMNNQLRQLNVLERKRALEADFKDWVASDSELAGEYGDVLEVLESAYDEREEAYYDMYNLREAIYSGVEIYDLALDARALARKLDADSDMEIKEQVAKLRERAADFYKNYNADTDKKTSIAMLQVYNARMEGRKKPQFILDILDKYKTFDAYVQKLFKKSIFVDEKQFMDFLDQPKLKKLEKDMAYADAKSMMSAYYDIADRMNDASSQISYGDRKFEKGLHLMLNDKSFYPDANFTMRLTYGKVGDYKPADAVHYDYYTTLKGVMEKEDPDNWEFVVPEKLKSLYEARDYGQYAAEDGTMRLCFITNNDITGGNSGSPVLNSKGEIFGLAFDSNWEGMSGDIAFEPYLQRVVNVDIRYVLFIIDKFAGAKHLVDEMEIVR